MWIAGLLRYGCVLVLVMIMGCNEKPRDVTFDRDFGDFSPVIGTWKSKIPLRLVQSGGKAYLVRTDAVVERPEELLSLPPGTEIQIERLVYQMRFETSFLWVYGSLVAGPYAGQPIVVFDTLFPPDLVDQARVYRGTEKTRNLVWSVAPDKLEKVP